MIDPQQLGPLLARCSFPPAGQELVCAVSGGADSLALMVLGVGAGCKVRAVHVDHGLRTGSDLEADLVAAAAERFCVAFSKVSVSIPDGSNLEERARQARLAALPREVATGHTMDDQAETVLCNLLRGAGIDGLGAMAPGPRHPILGVRRHETRSLCESLGLDPVKDPSNDDPRHLRNRVRRDLLPLACQIAGRDLVEVLARQAELMRDEAAFLNQLARELIADPQDARVLVGSPVVLARRAVREWVRLPGGRTGGHPPSAREVARVLQVAAGNGRATEISGARRVSRSRQRLSLSSPGAAADKVPPMKAARATTSLPGWAVEKVGEAVVDAGSIAKRVEELGGEITADYVGRAPLLVGVLKGAMVFMSDLARVIDLPVEVDFMAVSSYGSGTSTSGVVRIVKDLDTDLTGRHVIVVEDIIDSGLTLNYLRRYLAARGPASLEICALLVKEGVQRVSLDLRYVGFEIPSAFVVGYGLDLEERYRNLPSVHLLGDTTR
ncbi:MAG: hypoxanthine phosphoribosyltransferase [Acidimicrobiales bacterium]